MSELMTIQIDYKENDVFKNIAFLSQSLTDKEMDDLPEIAKGLLRKAGVKGNIRLGLVTVFDGCVQRISFENHKALEQISQTDPKKLKEYSNKIIRTYIDPGYAMEALHDELP